MPELIAGLIIFFTLHAISIVNEPWRNRMVQRLGEEVWQAVFGVLAFMGVALMIWGYGEVRQEPFFIYVPPSGLRHLSLLLMVLFFPLLIAAYAPGRIRALTKHPMLIATALWAAAHLMVNGTLADLLLFGTFLVWAIAELVSMAWRTPHPIKGLPAFSTRNDVIALLGGLLLYVTTLVLTHEWLVGMRIMPW